MTPRTKPKLGQHFLRDASAQRAIVDALGDIRSRTVVEIGPGQGALTRLLAERARRLIVIELDPALAAELRTQLHPAANVTVIEADILSVDLCVLLAEVGAADVIGNLPYYITSDILLALFAAGERCQIDRAVVMIQREVAERVAAPPGSRDYGALSATAQLHASVELLFTLAPESFSPPPEVDSSVLRLQFHSRFTELQVDRSEFLKFVRVCFAQKRKTLTNNLRVAGYTPATIKAAWPVALSPNVRAEAVTLDAMAELYRRLENGSRATAV